MPATAPPVAPRPRAPAPAPRDGQASITAPIAAGASVRPVVAESAESETAADTPAPVAAAATPAPIAPSPASVAAPDATAQQPVLLVEDNPVNRQVAQRLLTLAGITYESAENGKEALEKMNAGQFAVVLMDCQMPIMDGYTATRKRREYEAEHGLPRVPIVAMTANAMLGDREKCLDAGMDDYMSKPLNRALLESTLRTWMVTRPATLRPVATPVAAPAAAVTAAESAPAPLIVASTGPAVDTAILAELREIMGAEFVSLVQVFLEDAPLALERIHTLATGPNLMGIAAPAHTLKSTSANLGALVLSAQAKALEMDARQNTLRAAPARAAALAAEFERVAAALRKEIA